MRRTALFLMTILALTAFSQNVNIPYTQHSYKLHWQWGLIDMDIATANATVYCRNNNFEATLTGHSSPWESRIYCIADTLQAQMSLDKSDINYVIGWYRKPKVEEYDALNESKYRNTQSQGTLSASDATMETVDISANMLNVFYLAKALDFESMTPGESIDIPLYYGDYCESMRLTYIGKNQEVYNTFNTYEITVEYPYAGRMSDTPITVEIDAASRTPVLFSADIRIGHVEMILI